MLCCGTAHVFYPEATPERCTAAPLLDVDPVVLVRDRSGTRHDGGLLDQDVNDRAYAASGFLSVASAHLFGSAEERSVRAAPLSRMHECVVGVLARESEPVEPRL